MIKLKIKLTLRYQGFYVFEISDTNWTRYRNDDVIVDGKYGDGLLYDIQP